MTRALRTGERILLHDMANASSVAAIVAEIAPHIAQAIDEIRAYDAAMNQAERAPTGDDYNELFRILADVLPA